LLSESITPVLLDLKKKNKYTHILGDSSTFAKGILLRLAALLDVQPISDITVGASHVAVDAGYCGNDLQIVQTGKIVAPDFFIVIGISGASQHVAVMKENKILVAINKEGHAPILAMVDLFKILPEREKINIRCFFFYFNNY
jgi:electron transfer flavoprotein alpha subunit